MWRVISAMSAAWSPIRSILLKNSLLFQSDKFCLPPAVLPGQFHGKVTIHLLPDSGEDLPGWMAELKDTSQRLMEAAFANDMEPVADLLAPDAWVASDLSRLCGISPSCTQGYSPAPAGAG